MYNLFSINKNLQKLKDTSNLNNEEHNYIQYNYNVYTLKSIEYIFIQSFCHFRTFNLIDIQKFVSKYYDYYFFKSDILKHLLLQFCVKLENKNVYRLKNLDWKKYFTSNVVDIRDFKEYVKPKVYLNKTI